MYNLHFFSRCSKGNIYCIESDFSFGSGNQGQIYAVCSEPIKVITPATKALSAMSNEHVINNCILGTGCVVLLKFSILEGTKNDK